MEKRTICEFCGFSTKAHPKMFDSNLKCCVCGKKGCEECTTWIVSNNIKYVFHEKCRKKMTGTVTFPETEDETPWWISQVIDIVSIAPMILVFLIIILIAKHTGVKTISEEKLFAYIFISIASGLIARLVACAYFQDYSSSSRPNFSERLADETHGVALIGVYVIASIIAVVISIIVILSLSNVIGVFILPFIGFITILITGLVYYIIFPFFFGKTK